MSSIIKGIAGAAAIVVGTVTGQAWLVGIGISLEVSAFSSKPDDTGVGGTADQISYNPTEIRKMAVGYSPATLGSFLDEFSHDHLPWGGGNVGKNRVKETLLALYDFECDSLYEVWNGTNNKLTLGAEVGDLGHPVAEYTSGGKCHLYIKFFRGIWDQAADAHLITVSDGRYTSSDKGRGVCYVRITTAAAVDSKDQVWAGGEPQLRFVVKGAWLYNPAKDSTVGGSGSHRWGDTSTYEWSDLEPLIRYNVLRGFYHSNGNKFWGGFASHDEVRFDDAVAAISIADEDVALKAGGTQKRWRAGGEISVSTSPRDVCKALAEASAGRTVTVAGTYRIFVGAYNTPVASFSESDCFPQEDYEDDPKTPGDQLINAVYGSYTEPSEGWVVKSLPVRRNTDDITEDGALGERSTSIGPGFIQDFYQGQRAQEIVRRRKRRQVKATRVLHPIYYEVEPGDSLARNDATLGITDQAMYVDSIAVDSKINVTVNLTQDDAAIYTWDKDVDELPIQGGTLPSADPPAAAAPSGFDYTVITLTGDDGRVISTLRAVFDDPADASIIGFEVEYRVHGSTHSQFASVDSVTDGLLTLPGLIGNTTYDARYRFIGVPGRETPFSDWFEFTTDDVKIIGAEIAAGTLTGVHFAESISAVGIIEDGDSLPADNSVYDVVVWEHDGKLYRWDDVAGAWSTEVPAVDITGTIVSSQIAAAAITATHLASSIVAVEPLASLPVSGNFEGRVVLRTTDGQIFRYHSGDFTAAVPAVNVTGTLTDSQIADLAAAKISGTLTDSQIAAIAASKITGTIVASQIAAGAVTTSKFASGIVPVQVVSSLPGSGTEGDMAVLTTTGVLYRYHSSAWTAAVAAAIVTGTLTNSQIADLAATKITGTIVTAQIAAGAVTASQIASATITATQLADAAVSAAKVAANAITASKIYLGDPTNMVLNPYFSDASAWSLGTVTISSDSEVTGTLKVPGGIKVVAAGTTAQATSNCNSGNIATLGSVFKVNAGYKYRVSARVLAKTAFNGYFNLQILFYDQASGSLATGNVSGPDYRSSPAGSDTQTTIDGILTAPAGAVYAILKMNVTWPAGTSAGTGYWASPVMQLVVDNTIISAGTIDAAKLVASSVTASQIASATITATQLAAASVGASQIASAAVTAAKTSLAAIDSTTGNLTANSVSATQIVAGTITAAKIAAATITATEIAAGAIGTTALAALAVTAAKIAANTITASQIAAATITTTQIAAATITGSNIAATTITASNIAAGTITTTQLAAATIVAGNIAAGAIGTTQLAAGAITADKILIGTIGESLVLNSGAETGDISGWSSSRYQNTGTGSDSFTASSSEHYSGGYSFAIGKSAASRGAAYCSQLIPVTPGKTYVWRLACKGSAGDAAGLYHRIGEFNAFNATITSSTCTSFTAPASNVAVPSSWTTYEYTYTVPAGINFIALVVFNWSQTSTALTLYFDDVQFFEQTTSAVIADGAITTAKLVAGAVTAAKITSGTITTTQIASATIVAGNIAAATITGSNIAATTITAANIAAGTITATQIAASTITAGLIAAGAIGATQIAANAITASKLYIGDTSNIFPDPELVDSTVYTGGAFVLEAVASDGGPSKQQLRLTATSGTVAVNSLDFPVEASRSYFVSGWGETTGSGSANGGLFIVFYSDVAASTEISATQIGGTITSATPSIFSTLAAAPSNAKRGRLRFSRLSGGTTRNIAFSAPVVRRAADGELIVDGTITAAKITAGTITTTEIASATIVAGNIASATITGAKIAAATISASNIVSATITTTQIAAATITGSNIAATTITASNIAAGTITATQIAANTITAGKIAAAAIGTAQLAAAAVTASKVFIGDTSNLILDGQVLDSSAWAHVTSVVVTLATGEAGAGSQGYGGWLSGASDDGVNSLRFQVVAGSSYYVSANVYQSTSAVGSGALAIYLLWYDTTGSYLTANTIDATNSPDAWISCYGSATAPANAAFALLQIYKNGTVNGQHYYFGQPIVRLMYSGALIVDGSITAANIAAATITGTQIAAGTITATHLSVNSVTAGAIAAGAINVSTLIANNVIITGHLQVGAATTTDNDSGSVTVTTSYQDLCTASISIQNDNPVSVTVNCLGQTAASSQTFTFAVDVTVTDYGGTLVRTYTTSMTVPGSSTQNIILMGMGAPTSGATSGTVSATVKGKYAGSGSMSIGATVYLEQVLR